MPRSFPRDANRTTRRGREVFRPAVFGLLVKHHAVGVDDVLAGRSLVELLVALGAWSRGITVALTLLAICTLSCRIAIISCRLYFITGHWPVVKEWDLAQPSPGSGSTATRPWPARRPRPGRRSHTARDPEPPGRPGDVHD